MEMKATYIPRSLIQETLASPESQGKRLLEPLKSLSLQKGVPVHILEDVAVSNVAEIHTHEADLWICLSGNVTFVTGGTLVNPSTPNDPREIKGDAIEGGEEHVLSEGDVLFIPAGIAHSHYTDGSARLYIIKIPKV